MRSNQNYISNNQSRPVRELLIRALPYLKKHSPEHAIDFGCGLGIETAYLAKNLGCPVLAIDQDDEVLSLAKSRINSEDLPSIEFLKTTFEMLNRLPSCDILYSYHSLHFVHEDHYERLWNLILRSINSGGLLVISLFGNDDELVKTNQAVGITKLDLEKKLFDFKINYLNEFKESTEATFHSFDVIALKT
jgi:trans-aconitate methyltransferase